MAKEWIVGFVPALLIFLGLLGLNVLPVALVLTIGGILFFLIRNKVLPMNKEAGSHALIQGSRLSFDDIGGNERVKNELKEALDFLKKQDVVDRYGIRPLKGILLTGPPGTGKTLLAKAAANYTDSVFLAVSGSEFIEMYVGVGAQRIRKLFKEAKQLADKEKKGNAIIFIDEIDVLGGRRDGQQHREYDQTLNQLLTEMDGISTVDQPKVLVMGATNRKDMLDEALLRPGRFDRHIQVDLPEKRARLHILQLHSKNKPLSRGVALEKVAEETFGFSGAQLESLLNEAAIYAMREEKEKIEPTHLSLAIDKVMMGERTDREASKEERERVAVHELGHAITAEVLRPNSVAQVTLSPRGGALGYVRHHPGHDQYLYTLDYLEEQIMICLAGAAAEEMTFGNRSTGAKNDYEQAIRIAHTMIECGLSRLGIVEMKSLNKDSLQDETRFILEQLYRRTANLMQENRYILARALDFLLKEECISGEEFRRVWKSQSSTAQDTESQAG